VIPAPIPTERKSAVSLTKQPIKIPNNDQSVKLKATPIIILFIVLTNMLVSYIFYLIVL